MIKIEKELTITISGDDVQTLRNICTFTKRYLVNDKIFPREWKDTDTVVQSVSAFITKIFEEA